jgi:hypothetical protein
MSSVPRRKRFYHTARLSAVGSKPVISVFEDRRSVAILTGAAWHGNAESTLRNEPAESENIPSYDLKTVGWRQSVAGQVGRTAKHTLRPAWIGYGVPGPACLFRRIDPPTTGSRCRFSPTGASRAKASWAAMAARGAAAARQAGHRAARRRSGVPWGLTGQMNDQRQAVPAAVRPRPTSFTLGSIGLASPTTPGSRS